MISFSFDPWSGIRHYSVKFLDSNSYSARFSKDPPPPYPTPYGRYRDSRKYTISSISADSVLRMVSSTTIPLRKPLHSFPKPYLSTWNLLSFVSFGMPYSVKSTENCCYSAQISKDPPPPTLPQYEKVRIQKFYGIVTYG